jgi:hypothetical protein
LLERRGSAILKDTMKKLPIAVALLSLSIAAPVFACPEEHRTAEKKEKETMTADKADKADKAKDAKPAEKAKAAKPEKAKDAKPDKVSQR